VREEGVCVTTLPPPDQHGVKEWNSFRTQDIRTLPVDATL
jgi:hypothetical protein